MIDHVKPIPDGYHALTPHLIVKNAVDAIEFYKKAFAAVELFRMPGPRGKIMHAQLKIGDSIFMLADELPEMGSKAPEGVQAQFLYHYVVDVDAAAKTALAAGAKTVLPVQDYFYGNRSGTVIDPFGHVWILATRIENLTPEQLQERTMKALGAASK